MDKFGVSGVFEGCKGEKGSQTLFPISAESYGLEDFSWLQSRSARGRGSIAAKQSEPNGQELLLHQLSQFAAVAANAASPCCLQHLCLLTGHCPIGPLLRTLLRTLSSSKTPLQDTF